MQAVFDPIMDAVSQYLRIIWTFCLGLSTLYRCMTVGVQLLRETVNGSVNSMDAKVRTRLRACVRAPICRRMRTCACSVAGVGCGSSLGDLGGRRWNR